VLAGAGITAGVIIYLNFDLYALRETLLPIP